VGKSNGSTTKQALRWERILEQILRLAAQLRDARERKLMQYLRVAWGPVSTVLVHQNEVRGLYAEGCWRAGSEGAWRPRCGCRNTGRS
jgi:hypothetical protein